MSIKHWISCQAIADTLRRHPRFDTDFAAKMEDGAQQGDKETQDHWIFQHAATWPDIARALAAGERGKYDRPEWHYINLPLFVNDSDQTALGKLKINLATDYTLNQDAKQFNVLQAIKYCRTAIHSNADQPTKALAYCWLFHLVGDIHQPLHSSALFDVDHFPKGDRGGNEIKLTKGDNLHSLWDKLLGTQYFMRTVAKATTELSDREKYGDVWDSAAKKTDPREWAEESHNYCVSFVYAVPILDAVKAAPAGDKIPAIELPEDYYKAAGNIARERIVAAGVRLGELLKDNSGERVRRGQ